MEEIKNTIVDEVTEGAVEESVTTVVEEKAKMSFGKKALIVVGAIAGYKYVVKPLIKKGKEKIEARKAAKKEAAVETVEASTEE